MLQRGPSTSVHPLIAVLIGMALTSCSDSARSQDAEAAGVPADMSNPALALVVDTALNTYAALEYCDVESDRLKKLKQDMGSLAEQQGIPSAQFDAAFEAGLPEARQTTEANAAANPAETKQFCDAERGGF